MNVPPVSGPPIVVELKQPTNHWGKVAWGLLGLLVTLAGSSYPLFLKDKEKKEATQPLPAQGIVGFHITNPSAEEQIWGAYYRHERITIFTKVSLLPDGQKVLHNCRSFTNNGTRFIQTELTNF